MTRNKAYQWLWFKVVEKLIPVSTDPTLSRLERYSARMLWAVRLAILFALHRIFLGDSNCAMFYFYAVMKLFKRTTVNLGHGGTTLGEWWIYLTTTKSGKKLLALISKYEIIVNLGGNDLLLNQMDNVSSEIAKIKMLFPNVWACTIIPLHDNILSAISAATGTPHDAQYYHDGVLEINNYIRQDFAPKIIDLYALFVDGQGNENTIELKDMVHIAEKMCKELRWVLDKV